MTNRLVHWLQSLSADDWHRRPAGAWDGSPPANLAAIEAAERKFGVRFPDDFRELLLASDGGALAGPAESINIDHVDALVERNPEEPDEEALRGMITIGDNGGGAIYFYDPSGRLKHGEWALYWLNLGDLALQNSRFAGKDLSDVLRSIADGICFFEQPRIGV